MLVVICHASPGGDACGCAPHDNRDTRRTSSPAPPLSLAPHAPASTPEKTWLLDSPPPCPGEDPPLPRWPPCAPDDTLWSFAAVPAVRTRPPRSQTSSYLSLRLQTKRTRDAQQALGSRAGAASCGPAPWPPGPRDASEPPRPPGAPVSPRQTAGAVGDAGCTLAERIPPSARTSRGRCRSPGSSEHEHRKLTQK